MISRLLTVRDIAKILVVSEGTIRNRLYRGDPMPPSLVIGKKRLFPLEEFEAWIDSHRTNQDQSTHEK